MRKEGRARDGDEGETEEVMENMINMAEKIKEHEKSGPWTVGGV